MKKIIITLTVLFVFSILAQPVYSTSFTNTDFSAIRDNGGKKKPISIGSNRASGNMLLRFTAVKAGATTITILNESGVKVLQQTNQLKKNINSIPLENATGLTEGLYTVQLIFNNETFITKMLIWK